MANRFFVGVKDIAEPAWLGNVEPFLRKAMQKLGFDGEDLSVLFCDDSFIAQMNKTYRQIDGATDVLSFENSAEYIEDGEKWLSVGDILISVDSLAQNAEKFGVSFDCELKRLLVHGLLHLNGLDHGDEHLELGKKPECEMLVLQENTLADFEHEHIVAT